MESFNNLDYLIILVVCIGAAIGFGKGFFVSLFSFAGKIMAAYLAITFIRPFISIIQVKEMFLKGLTAAINERLPLAEDLKNIPLQSNNDGMTVAGHNMIMEVIGQNLTQEMERMYIIGQGLGLSSLGEMLSLVIANYLLNIVSFFLLFFLILLLIAIIKSIIFKLLSLSDIASGIDKFLGMFFGAAVDVFVLALLLGFTADLLFLFPPAENGLFSTGRIVIDNSFFHEHLYAIYRLLISEGFKLI